MVKIDSKKKGGGTGKKEKNATNKVVASQPSEWQRTATKTSRGMIASNLYCASLRNIVKKNLYTSASA